MDLNDRKLSDEALLWVKSHRKEIVEKFAGRYPSVADIPISIFMAGSPGAGKTEFSTRLLAELRESIVRIDPDEIRNSLPSYVAGKAHLFQAAVSVAVEKIHDHVLQKQKDFLLDGTFSNLVKARENIRRSQEKGRTIIVQYVFQEPLVAWDFTLKREAVEGRNIPKESFVEQLFAARENISTIKKEFGAVVEIDLVRRNIQTNQYTIQFDIVDVVEAVQIGYTREELLKLL